MSQVSPLNNSLKGFWSYLVGIRKVLLLRMCKLSLIGRCRSNVLHKGVIKRLELKVIYEGTSLTLLTSRNIPNGTSTNTLETLSMKAIPNSTWSWCAGQSLCPLLSMIMLTVIASWGFFQVLQKQLLIWIFCNFTFVKELLRKQGIIGQKRNVEKMEVWWRCHGDSMSQGKLHTWVMILVYIE